MCELIKNKILYNVILSFTFQYSFGKCNKLSFSFLNILLCVKHNILMFNLINHKKIKKLLKKKFAKQYDIYDINEQYLQKQNILVIFLKLV